MSEITIDDNITARNSHNRARTYRAKALLRKLDHESFATGLADADKAIMAMTAVRDWLVALLAKWLSDLPAELAALESQDALHARLTEVVHDGLAYLSAQAKEMARDLAGEAGSAVDALVAHGGATYLDRFARAVAPRPHLTVSAWADQYRWLSQKSSGEPGKWKTERNPMLREIMDCLSVQSDVRRIVIMKPAQVGITEACVNWIGYVMQHAPAPLMVLLPTLENRDKWITQKLNPLLLETPVIAELFDVKRERDASNSRDNKDFPGGVLFLAGGNSPNSYAQVSARYVIMDDLDRFPEEVGDEGHPVALARNRAKAFARYKLLLISTPTVRDTSHIEAEYLKSDMRRYHLACPHCGEYQVLEWKHLSWPAHCATSGTVSSVWYVCPANGCVIEEHHKPEMLAHGRWIAQRPEVKTRGYQINGLYAPIGLGKSWLELAQEWLDAQKDPVALKSFINTELAETWEDRSHAVKPKHLSERASAHKAGEIPLGCLLLTAGVDTQDNRLEVHVQGFGPMGKSGGGSSERGLIHWTIDYIVIPGNPAHDAVWATLAEVLNRPYVNARGRELRIEATAIDEGGHHTDDVRHFAMSGRARRLMAVRGMNRASRTIMPGPPKATDINRLGKKLTGGAKTWDVGTDVAKSYLMKNLVADAELPAEAQRIRFNSELEDSFYEMLLAESFDPTRNRWVKKAGKRNEALDTWGYGWFAAHHPQLAVPRKTRKEWADLAAVLEPPVREDGTVAPLAEKPDIKPARSVQRPAQRSTGGGSHGFY
jgi:phage terminase large subunit GpA-like protein